jgi:hypothetical protein
MTGTANTQLTTHQDSTTAEQINRHNSYHSQNKGRQSCKCFIPMLPCGPSTPPPPVIEPERSNTKMMSRGKHTLCSGPGGITLRAKVPRASPASGAGGSICTTAVMLSRHTPYCTRRSHWGQACGAGKSSGTRHAETRSSFWSVSPVVVGDEGTELGNLLCGERLLTTGAETRHARLLGACLEGTTERTTLLGWCDARHTTAPNKHTTSQCSAT